MRVVGRKRREGEAEDFVNDSSDLGEYEEEEQRMVVRKSKSKRRPEREASGGSEEEDEMVVERRHRKTKMQERKRRDRELDEQVPARLRGKSKSEKQNF